MGGFDSDSEMMRSQQNKDAPETIEADEADAARGPSDVDDATRLEREAAKAGGETRSATETMDDVLDANRKASGAGRPGDATTKDAGTDGSASLAQTDRSLVGR